MVVSQLSYPVPSIRREEYRYLVRATNWAYVIDVVFVSVKSN